MKVFNVLNFGAKRDGISDDTPAIQKAIDAVISSGGGIVYFPAGEYSIKPQKSGDHALNVINAQSIIFQGEGIGATVLKFHIFDGSDPTNNWEVINGALWRGNGIHIRTNDNPSDKSKHVAFYDLEIDGNVTPGNQHNKSFPADPQTGDGWDTTHKGISFCGYYGVVHFERIHVHNWRGEITYSGDISIDSFTALESKFNSSNAQGININIATKHHVENCEFFDLGADAFEALLRGSATYVNNKIYDCLIGMAIGQFEQYPGAVDNPIIISGNDIRNCRLVGIFYYGTFGKINDNIITNCGNEGPGSIVIQPGFQLNPGWPNKRDKISVMNNSIYAEGVTVGNGIIISSNETSILSNCTISGNLFEGIGDGLFGTVFRTNIGIGGENSSFVYNIIKNAKVYMEHMPIDAVVPLCFGNIATGIETKASFTQQQITANNTLIVLGPELQVFGDAAGLEPTIDASQYQLGHRCIVQGFPTNPVTFPLSSAAFKCKAARLMDSVDKYLILEFVKTSGGNLFAEINFLDLT